MHCIIPHDKISQQHPWPHNHTVVPITLVTIPLQVVRILNFSYIMQVTSITNFGIMRTFGAGNRPHYTSIMEFHPFATNLPVRNCGLQHVKIQTGSQIT